MPAAFRSQCFSSPDHQYLGLGPIGICCLSNVRQALDDQPSVSQIVHENRILRRATESIKRLDKASPAIQAVSDSRRLLVYVVRSPGYGAASHMISGCRYTMYCMVQTVGVQIVRLKIWCNYGICFLGARSAGKSHNFQALNALSHWLRYLQLY